MPGKVKAKEDEAKRASVDHPLKVGRFSIKSKD
jgi:hypothetical protein